MLGNPDEIGEPRARVDGKGHRLPVDIERAAGYSDAAVGGSLPPPPLRTPPRSVSMNRFAFLRTRTVIVDENHGPGAVDHACGCEIVVGRRRSKIDVEGERLRQAI